MACHNKASRRVAQKIMVRTESLAEHLRATKPILPLRVYPDPSDGSRFGIEPCCSEIDCACEVVIEEGYDPDHTVLAPVYWRIVKRGDERLYCSTFQVGRDEIVKAWGECGLAHYDPKGMAVARIEVVLPIDLEAGLSPQTIGCCGEVAAGLFLRPSLRARIEKNESKAQAEAAIPRVKERLKEIMEARKNLAPSVAPDLIANARVSKQTRFESSNQLPDNEGRVFTTGVPDAPLQCIGRLGLDGRWYVGRYTLTSYDEYSPVLNNVPAGIIVLRDEPVADAMIRHCIDQVFGAAFAGHAPPGFADFRRQLAASRFRRGQ